MECKVFPREQAQQICAALYDLIIKTASLDSANKSWNDIVQFLKEIHCLLLRESKENINIAPSLMYVDARLYKRKSSVGRITSVPHSRDDKFIEQMTCVLGRVADTLKDKIVKVRKRISYDRHNLAVTIGTVNRKAGISRGKAVLFNCQSADA